MVGAAPCLCMWSHAADFVTHCLRLRTFAAAAFRAAKQAKAALEAAAKQ